MMKSSPRSWRHLLVAGVLTVTIVSCSTSGGDTDATGTTIGGDVEVTVADLEAILPTAEEVGRGYQVQPSTGDDESADDDTTEAAVEAACPGMEGAFGDLGGDNTDASEVSMLDADNRGFEVKINAAPGLSPETLDEQVATINGCGVIDFTNDDGSDITIILGAERTDDFGEVAVNFTMDMTVDHESLAAPYEIGFVSRSFRVGSLSSTIMVVDGGDPATMEAFPAHNDLLDEYSAEMETRLTDLLAG